jgi:hypothetical protein
MNPLSPWSVVFFIPKSFPGLPFLSSKGTTRLCTPNLTHSCLCSVPVYSLRTHLCSCLQTCEAIVGFLSSFEGKSDHYLIIHPSSTVWMTLSRNDPFLSTHRLRLIPR